MPPYESLADARAYDNRLALLRWRILDYPSPAVLPPELTGVEPRELFDRTGYDRLRFGARLGDVLHG